MNNKIYYPEVDIVKGIAILLVIMGHACCTFPMNLDAELSWLHPFFRCVQMPLFFLASGFLFKMNGGGDFWRKKLTRLLIPYIVFASLSILLRFAFAPFTRSGSPGLLNSVIALFTGGYYWFLYALLVIMVLCRFLKEKRFLCMALIFSFIVPYFIGDGQVPSIVYRITYFLFFFILGICVKPYYASLTLNYKRLYCISLSCLIVYIILLCPFVRQFVEFKHLTQIIGCVAFWGVSLMIAQTKLLNRILSFFGHYSLQFYLNHLLILLPCFYLGKFFPVQIPLVQWLVVFVSATFLSWLMLLIENKVKFLHKFCGL